MKKYEREIAELLDKMDTFVPEESRAKRAKRRLNAFLGRVQELATGAAERWRWSSTHLFIASLVLAVVGYGLRDIVPRAAPLVSLISLVLFIAAFAVDIRGRRRRKMERRWRGRVVDLQEYRYGRWATLRYHWTLFRSSVGRWLNRRFGRR